MAGDSKTLDGRIALVTGASRGIGRAVALRFAAEGAHVVALARTQGALEELDDEIRKITGKPATLIVENITDFDKLDQVGAALFTRYGKLDILVGNAGAAGAALAGRALHAENVDRCVRGECDRELAADPQSRPAAARFRRRPRPVRHLRCGKTHEYVLGTLTRPPRRRWKAWC